MSNPKIRSFLARLPSIPSASNRGSAGFWLVVEVFVAWSVVGNGVLLPVLETLRFTFDFHYALLAEVLGVGLGEKV